MSLLIVTFFALTAAGAADEPAGQPAPDAAAARSAIAKGISFLEDEGVSWMNDRKCASCHHAPLTIWSLNEARNFGYAVDEATLAEVTSWSFADDDRSKVLVVNPNKEPTVLSQAPMLLALATGSIRNVDDNIRAGYKRLVERVVTEQFPEGTWGLPAGGRPPMADSNEIMTIWTVLALSAKGLPNEAAAAQIEKARKWLAENPRGESHQSQIARLLLDQHFATPRGDLQPAIDRLLKLQNEDGGWSQIPERGSDAYATGQSLYVLGRSGETAANNAAVAKAQAWLVSKQQAEGSWNMTPRPNKPGDKESEKTGPITYVGTAWATLGLIRTTPPMEPAATGAAASTGSN
jgi:hypothetical protein